MVAHFTMRTYGVKQEFRFADGIWLHRKSRQIRFFFRKDFFTSKMRNIESEQPSQIKTMPPPPRASTTYTIHFNYKSFWGQFFTYLSIQKTFYK